MTRLAATPKKDKRQGREERKGAVGGPVIFRGDWKPGRQPRGDTLPWVVLSFLDLTRVVCQAELEGKHYGQLIRDPLPHLDSELDWRSKLFVSEGVRRTMGVQ